MGQVVMYKLTVYMVSEAHEKKYREEEWCAEGIRVLVHIEL
jgi:hypothetical protein